MSDIKKNFDQALADAKKLPAKPDNDTLLKLYALFKQSTEGDVSGEKPGFFDFVATAKYEAWEGLAGTDKEDAMTRYVALVGDLKQRAG